MFRNYFKVVFRNIKQNKFISFATMGGLAVGLTSFLLLLLYLNNELSYDQWNPSLKNVYRISEETAFNYANNPAPAALAPFLQQHVPGISAYTKMQQSGDYELLFSAGDKKIYQKNVVSADSGFLDVFPYQLLAGDRATAFKSPDALLLTPEMSEKLFGKEDPIGKVVKVYNQLPLTVTGIIAPVNTPSHIKAMAVMRDPAKGDITESWGNISYITYVRLDGPVKISKFENQINRAYYDHHLKNDNKTYEEYVRGSKQRGLFAEQLKDIHNFPRLGKSSFKTTMILFALALLLLVSGALNAGNLSLVKALQRNREIGVRKVLGASKLQIFKQFLLETGAQCLISLVIAVGLLFLVLPWFNKMFDLSLSVNHMPFAGKVILQIAGALVAIVFIAGLYPAWLFARQTAMVVLKQKIKMSTKGFQFNNALLVVQFAVSMFFIVSALLMLQQMNYMKKRDIGFSPAQIVQLEVMQSTWENNFSNTRAKLLEIPGVEQVSKTTEVPGAYIDTSSTRFGYNGKLVDLTSVRVSTQFFQTLNIPVKAGRSFDDEHAEDLDNTAIINETAAKMLGGEVVGSRIHFEGCDSIPYKIVGVVKDFQVQGFENGIRPKLYSISNAHCTFRTGNTLLVKVKSANADKTLAALTAVWEGIEPGIPLRYSFLDDNFAKLFENYTRVQNLVQVFTIISVMIALMGLLALAVYVTGQRNKEISIRKVLGAGMGNLVFLLSADFLKLVLIAIVLISPFAWYLLDYWLKDFAYRIDIGVGVFALAAFVVVFMALVTVGWQAVKASGANPAANLKGE